MLPRLRLKKTSRRLIHNSKGFSSIVGAVFAVLIMISLIATVFVWTLSQNTSYNNAVRQSNQADLDRSNEKILTNITAYGNGLNSVIVNGTLENNGPQSVHIVTLWVVNTNNTHFTYKTPLDITLPPGTVTTLSGSTAINVTLPNSAIDSLSCWFISERGNAIGKYGVLGDTTTIVNPGTTLNNTIYAQVSQGIGAVAMDFDDFRYYHPIQIGGTWWINSSSAEMPLGTQGYYLTNTSGGVVFRLNLTNWDPQKRDISLTSHSAFWMISPTTNPQQPRSDWWYVVNVDPVNGYILSPYRQLWRNITLPYGVPTTVYFSSNKDIFTITVPTKFEPNVPSVGYAGAVNLMLFGTIGNEYYGQNLPFVSIYVAS